MAELAARFRLLEDSRRRAYPQRAHRHTRTVSSAGTDRMTSWSRAVADAAGSPSSPVRPAGHRSDLQQGLLT